MGGLVVKVPVAAKSKFLMQVFDVIVDFNGIVIFDPLLLERFYTKLTPGENLYERFTGSEEGDAVVSQGIVVPLIGINDSIYKVIIRQGNEEPAIPQDSIIVSNGSFPLRVVGRAVISDMSTLLEWSPGDGWQELPIPAGMYSVRINGFRQMEKGTVSNFGCEIIFDRCDNLPKFTGSLSQNMQVLELPE